MTQPFHVTITAQRRAFGAISQSRCVCVQGHLLIWHIYYPLSDIWKGSELGILISKTPFRASNTSQQRQRQVCGRILSLLLPVSMFISSSFHPGVVSPLWTTKTTSSPPLLFWLVISRTCDSAGQHIT